MTNLKINVRVDRFKNSINKFFTLKTQSLRFDKDNHLVTTISHKEILKLNNDLTKFIKDNRIDGKNTYKGKDL